MDVIVENYQSVKKVVLKIEGITVLKGVSNAGKSSVAKALYAATHNRFRAGCIRYGEPYCRVKLRFKKGEPTLTIKRRPTGSPLFELDDYSWNKLNRDLPLEVRKFLNFGTLNVSNSEIYSLNFFSQFQPPLLAEYSTKKIMDILSASKAVDDLNLVRKVVDQRRERNRGAFDQIDSVLTETKVALAKAIDLQEQFSKLNSVDGYAETLEKSEEEEEKLVTLLKLLKEKEFETKKVALLKEYLIKVGELNVLEDTSSSLNELKRLKTSREKLVSNLALLNQLLSSVSIKEDLDVTEKSCNILLSYMIYCVKTRNYIDRAKGIYNDYYSNRDLFEDLESEESNLEVLKSLLDNSDTLSNSLVYLKSLEKKVSRLETLKQGSKECIRSMESLTTLKTLLDNKQMLEKSIEQDKNFVDNNLCPYCMRPMDEEHNH